MEMIGGVHDREVWEKQTKKYFKKEDPLYPCSASFMPPEAKSVCYTYLTPHLFQVAGANLGYPKPADFKKAFTYCSSLKDQDRRSCFGGFGKEFTVLAQSRDIRAIDKLNDSQLETVLDWCELALEKDGIANCTTEALSSLYWGGENDPAASIRFCALADKRGLGEVCETAFFNAVSHFVQDPAYRQNICNLTPEKFQDMCRSRLL
jgi:hypothetical protein